MIYSFYVADNACNNEIYELHYNLISQICNVFDRIIFVICHNGNMNDDIIYNIKSKLINITGECNNITFIFEHNNKNFREGIIFKKYIIDKLDQYDDYLTFFAHSKGVSNQYGIDHIDNLKLWIFLLYYLNFRWLFEVRKKLNTYSKEYDYMSFGGLYFKDTRHTNKYHWFYSGSFQWLNTFKINKYIKDNNINITPFICEEGETLKRCAELFIGNIFDSNYAAFRLDQRYNKQNDNRYHNWGWEISYENIDIFLNDYVYIDDYNELFENYEKILIPIYNE